MEKLNVLLMPLGSFGDVNPFIGLGLALRERGHQVTVLANGFFESYVGKTGLDFVEVGAAEDFERLSQDPDLWGPAGVARFFTSTLEINLIRSQYKAIMERYIPGRTVVVAAGWVFGAHIARDQPGVPLVTMHLYPSCFYSIYKPPPGLKILSWIRSFAITIKGLYNRSDKVDVFQVCAPNINSLRRELGLDPIEQILRWWHSPDCVLAFFPPFFAQPQPHWPPQTRLVGFPFFDADRTNPLPEALPEFLKASEVTIVFTAGTAMACARQFFRESVGVCEALGLRGILLTLYPEQIPDSLPETVRHFNYVPFGQLFPLVDAVVHHGGLGTVAQCLRAGVRQLIVPFSLDQPENARRVERLGVGLSIKATDYHGEKLIWKINQLLKSERLKTTALQWKQAFQDADAFTLACQEIETVVKT